MEAHMEPEELASVRNAPEGDPRRAHLEACTQCQVLLESYRRFLEEPVDDPATDALTLRLRTAIEGQVQGSDSLRDQGFPSRTSSSEVGFWNRLRSGVAWIGRPPVLVAAALLIVAGTVVVWQGLHRDEGRILLRQDGQAGRPSAGDHAIEWLPSSRQPDGALELAWKPLPGADAYEIRVYSATLEELTRLGPVVSTRFLLSPKSAALATIPDTVVIRVTAFFRSDPVGDSRLLTVVWR